MAQQQDLEIMQGSDYNQVFKFFEDEEKTIPLDLTGVTAAMKIRLEDYDGKVLIDLVSPTYLSINEGASTIGVNIPSAMSSALSPVNKGDDSISGVYDLEITNAGIVTRVVQGVAIITREATR